MDNKINDVYELMKDRQLYILCANETKRKGSGGATKRGSFDTYRSGVDRSQGGCRDVGFILSERLSECVNGSECIKFESLKGYDLKDLKEYECRLRIDELSVKYLLYADDQVILAPSAGGL
ncbi:hypothetical protein EVAR_67024_1 [Eumeta japonica]|uniref:Reverse transcriptase domain-containing protein n=1 Tax=Eumeta variegata TaxID=151549 RepID=A0A4C1ZZK7_EUMVA|nr:hypothetical protein EVAR_67024_1 [Eumeta japonica]